jgi:hypothetical protein
MHKDLDLLNAFLTRAEREKEFRGYRHLLRQAEAFHLDHETLEVVGEMASGEQRHRMMPLYRELARLPFETVWIEFDYAHLHAWRVACGYTKPLDAPDQSMVYGLDSDRHVVGVPTQMGFLCERLQAHEDSYRITTVGWMSAGHGDPPAACMFPVCHNVTTGRDKVIFGGNRADRAEINDIIWSANRSPIPAIAWGMEAYNGVDVHAWLASPLCQTNGVEPEGVFEDTMIRKYGLKDGLERIRRGMEAFTLEQKGDLRFVVAALALLNHVPVTYKPYKPKGRMLASGTTRPFMESRVVHIDVPSSRRRIKVIDQHLRNSLVLQRRKRHNVRGHWRVSNRSHGDRWQPFTDPFTLQRRWRIWIADHQRGDASLGWVDHRYEIAGRPGALAAVLPSTEEKTHA